MEIYRTDGGGKSFADERLFKLVKLINSNTHDGFFDDIKTIRDHKGHLMIILKNDFKNDLEYIFSVFLVFWHLLNDYQVSIYFDGFCVYGDNLNDKW